MPPAQHAAVAPRYLVLLPANPAPTGGTNILLWLIEMLNGAGYRAAALYGSQSYSYDFRFFTSARFYSPERDHMFCQGGAGSGKA